MAGKPRKDSKPTPAKPPAPIPVVIPSDAPVNYGDRKRHRTR